MFRLTLAVILFFSYPSEASITILGNHKLSQFQKDDLEQVMSDILLWISKNSTYEATSELPVVEFVPKEMVSGQKCVSNCPVALFSAEDGTLRLSVSLDVRLDSTETPFLAHELVHYYQWRAKKFHAGSIPCEENIELELEAYNLQRKYYATHGGRFMPAPTPSLFCDAEGNFMVGPWLS